MSDGKPAALRAAKTSLRRRMRSALSSTSAASRAAQSAAVMARLMALPAYAGAASVAVYLSMREQEVDTEQIVRHALSSNKRCYVPRFFPSSPSRPMEMVALRGVQDLESLPRDSKWGIRQPAEDDKSREVWSPSTQLDLIIVPGLAFTSEGKRLGRGKGFYDAFLRRACAKKTDENCGKMDENCGKTDVKCGKTATVALAFREQILDDLPTDEHDVDVDVVLGPDA